MPIKHKHKVTKSHINGWPIKVMRQWERKALEALAGGEYRQFGVAAEEHFWKLAADEEWYEENTPFTPLHELAQQLLDEHKRKYPGVTTESEKEVA